MNLLKSIFISNYMMLLMGVSGYAGWMLFQGESPVAWSGVLLTALPLLTVITWLLLFKNVARTSAHFPVVNFLGAIGVVGEAVGPLALPSGAATAKSAKAASP